MADQKKPEQQKQDTLPAWLTYAAMVDVRNAEVEITELMIRRACREMEALQQFPFACRTARSESP